MSIFLWCGALGMKKVECADGGEALAEFELLHLVSALNWHLQSLPVWP
jgi:hypothetical protein